MCKEYESLTFEEQIQLFEKRGLIINDKEKAKQKLQYINYYKLKELAYPFYERDENGVYLYKNIDFEEIIKRYYQDKHIRLSILECTEKIEVAFKTRFCYLLGKKYGAYGYLKFNNWFDKETYCKYYVSEKQGDFKKRLKENSKLLDTHCIKEYIATQDKKIEDVKIPIWMLVEILTFGEIVYFYEMMSTSNKVEIANDFDANYDEFLSWIKCLKFIRNKCTHNLNIIDLKLKTKPKLREKWREWLLIDNNKQSSGKIADILIPMVYLTIKINDKFIFNDLQRCINRLIHKDNEKARLLGFKDSHISMNFIDLLGGKFKKNRKISNRVIKRRLK
ncbi:hypothetical protein HMPREF9628_00126 [Peptoanaerobacter stomatis]|uniref:Abi-like protein n=1 Tax=Peptoanaerobacter stomatis TaxID=796937 RepID=G9XA35_9FIRM|nr:Abi family protein [Peptoanaerobacter stomatis]EHL20281.1 hypothetical protein HMPREF9628_00126 [Peptoanaerobacter stomatis]